MPSSRRRLECRVGWGRLYGPRNRKVHPECWAKFHFASSAPGSLLAPLSAAQLWFQGGAAYTAQGTVRFTQSAGQNSDSDFSGRFNFQIPFWIFGPV